MSKSKSSQARAAAAIRKELKRQGLDVRARSDSFSMGDSVTVDVLTPDLPPERRREIKAYCDQYQYGSFDGMTDSYNYTNRRDDLPGQTKWLHVNFEQSDAIKAAIREFIDDDNPHSDEVHRVWTGAHCRAAEFWAEWAEQHRPTEPEAVAQGAAYRIEKHYHDKHQFDFWLVVLADRADREQFEQLRDSCKAAGGWYSRKWRSTPGGFAFKEREQAGSWALQEFGGDTPPDPKPRDEVKRSEDSRKAEKFREMADKVAAEVEAKRGDHLENTPKRQREAMSRRIDADHLERTGQALRALADLLEAGKLPTILRKFASKKAIHSALRTRTESGGYYHVADTGEHADESPEAAALWQLIDGKDPEQEQADRLRDLRADVRGRKIPGYFPTPPDLAADMVDKLDIRHRRPWSLLEPSAGCGAILDAVEQLANPPEVQCHEVNGQLCRILEAKGYDPLGDFLRAEAVPDFDAVLMNPPFEKLQDVEHVRHAFDFLKPGGRLVAIMSPAPFFHDTSKAREFREWFGELDAEAEDIEAGAFKASGTGVASRLVVIDKPEEVEAIAGPVDEVRPGLTYEQEKRIALRAEYEGKKPRQDAGVPSQGGQMLLI